MEIIISSASSGGSGAFEGNIGEASISSGASSKAVVFTTPFADTSYSIIVTIQNLTDATPIFLNPVITAKSTTGFTVLFNAPTDTINYVLEYIAGVFA